MQIRGMLSSPFWLGKLACGMILGRQWLHSTISCSQSPIFSSRSGYSCESPYDRELLDILMKVRLDFILSWSTIVTNVQTFQARLVELMDQAQHFAGTSSSAGAVSGGEGGEDFREGLEATERERMWSLPQPLDPLQRCGVYSVCSRPRQC